MQQVLFTLPLFKDSFPPDGVPMYGFGAMLFVAFVAVVLWGSRRVRTYAGLQPERFQDMLIVVFVTGIIGARILYMIQYSHHFPDKSIGGLMGSFFKIWEGGIIFYGSVVGGALGYGLFYWYVLRRLQINGWQLADACAPLLALGLAIGRFGCYLNGCCWGQVACEQCQYVPLGAAHFPLLPAHARQQLVGDQSGREPSHYLQSAVGFIRSPRLTSDGYQLVVVGVEPGSPAARVGVQPGDRVTTVNGEPNPMKGPTRDRLDEVTQNWPRGQSRLTLGLVDREGTERTVTFTPVTVGLYPTQLYESVSMVIIILFLLAYYRYRRHDGQLFTMLMAAYAIHRFVNESLRIEPTVAMGLTLSQWGSIVIMTLAVGIELYLWRTQPSRWKGKSAVGTPPTPDGTPAPPAAQA